VQSKKKKKDKILVFGKQIAVLPVHGSKNAENHI
jgi:hypothetical protein